MGVWRGSRGPGLRAVGRGAYLLLKHQQVSLPLWAGKASASGGERGKVLPWVTLLIRWGQLLNVGGFSGVQWSQLRTLWCRRVVACGAAAESVRGGGWAARLSSPPPRAHPSLQGL